MPWRAPGQAAAADEKAAAVVHVSGTQVPINANQGKYRMRGDLRGTWFVDTTKVLHSSPRLFVASGHERFRGCVDADRDKRCAPGEPSGVMRFAYLYWASFDAQGDLVRGECVHPVTGGGGAFARARGVLHMVDRPVAGGEVRTTYRGRLRLAGDGCCRSPAAPSRLGASAALARPVRLPRAECGAVLVGTRPRPSLWRRRWRARASRGW